jgi:hypothetical protein
LILDRKEFIKSVLILGAASQLPWIVSCSEKEQDDRVNLKVNSTLQAVLNILLPHSESRPGALDFFADKYISQLKNDPQIKRDSYNKLMSNFDSLDQFAGEDFYQLGQKKQKESFQKFLAEGNETWASRLMTYCFEAMLCHPIYNINPNEIGNIWLDHTMGVPEPDKKNMYPQILKTIREN